MTPSRLSLCWLTVAGAHPLEHIDAALAGGFNAIGLRLVPPAPRDPLIPVVGEEPLIREIQARLAGSGLAVVDVETVWIGRDLDIAGLRPALDVARRLGASGLVTMGNDDDEARLADTFARLCEEAARFGLYVGMEFAAYTKTPTIQAAHRLVKESGHQNGRVLIDALHLARSGGMPSDVAQIDPKRLDYCQIADARSPRPSGNDALRTEARGGRLLLGEGDLPLAALLDALPAGLPIGVETPTREHADKTAIERGRLAGIAAHRFLDHYARRASLREGAG